MPRPVTPKPENVMWCHLKAGAAIAAIALLLACSETGETGRSADMGASASVEAADAPMVVAEPAPVMESPAPESGGGRFVNPRRGVVTAGDIDDTLNLAAFNRFQSTTARKLGLPGTNLKGMVRLQLVDPSGKPAPGLPITLRRPGTSQPFYQGVSGVDGRISVLPSLHGGGTLSQVELRVFGDGQSDFSTVRPTRDSHVVQVPYEGKWQPDFLDLVFVFDTTGSMGDELDWLTREFSGIVQAARRAAPGADIRFGLIAYRDQGDAYVVRNFGFTNGQGTMQTWLRSLDAAGGGDYPEAAAGAMQAAAGLNWRRGKGERLLFHIADAPPHSSQAKAYLNAARTVAARDVQIFGLGASGVAEESELLMRQASVISAGRYLFLTDDSGVGYAHAEPTIACYRVTRLKSLLTRILTSELTGQRREARGSEVIREVGSYRNGVCRQ